jgi:hypothetical protein
MAGGLIGDGSVAAARAWLAAASPALGLPATNIAGFLALRAWHRRQAGALTAEEQDTLAEEQDTLAALLPALC